jgi:hypothetical protein
MRMRITVNTTGNRAADLRTATELQRELWAHAPVEIDPGQPLHGIHRDLGGHPYFEFSTANPVEVHRVVQDQGYGERVEASEAQEAIGEACQDCGNIAGPILPTVCPNCQFRDISPCPVCHQEIPRQNYTSLGGDLFRCPNCRNRVRFRFNDPMFLPDGSYNQPLIVIDEVATPHEVR